jgi:hypothetical protein
MKKLLSSFTSPCTIAINLDPSEKLNQVDIDYSKQNDIEANDYNLVRSKPKTVQRTILVNDPNDHYAPVCVILYNTIPSNCILYTGRPKSTIHEI